MARESVHGAEEVRHLHRLARLNTLVLDDDLVAPQDELDEASQLTGTSEGNLDEWFAEIAAAAAAKSE